MYSRLKRILAGAVAVATALSMAVISPHAEEGDGYTEIALNSYDTEVSDASLTPTFDGEGVMYLAGDGRHLLYHIGAVEDGEVEAVRIEYKHDGKNRTHNFFAGYMFDSAKEKTSANIRNGKSDYSRELFRKNGNETFTHESNDAVKNGDFSILTFTADDFANLSGVKHGNDLWLNLTVCDHTYIKSLAIKKKEKEVPRPTRIEISGQKSIDLGGLDSFPAEYEYTAQVYDQNDEVMLEQAVTWSSVSNVTNGAVEISSDGKLNIPQNAPVQTVTITAVCGDAQESIEVFLDRLSADAIEIIGADSINSYIATQERQFVYAAKVLDQNGNEMTGQTVVWEFSTDAREGAATFRDGIVTVPVGVADQTLTLTAKCGNVTQTKTVKIEKKIVDLPETFPAEHSMKLRGLGNTETMKIDPEFEEIGMKAAAPGLFRFNLSQVINDAAGAITGITFTAYKESGASIALGLWEYADPKDEQRTDNRAWIETDWLNTENKAEVCNNYSLVFGFDDFGTRHDTAAQNYAQGRDSYIAPIATASVSDDKYTFSITGSALESVLAHAKEKDGIVELVVTSADLDARGGSVFKMYMSGVAEKNAQYMPNLTVAYDLPSTPRRVEIAGNDTLYINSQASSYTSSYTAAVYDQHGELYASQEVEWSADLGETSNVTFNSSTGALTINSNSGEGVVTLTAKSAFAVGTKKVTVKKIPDSFQNGDFEDTDDSYLAAHWTSNVPVYKLNFDETDFYNPWNESNTNNGNTLFTRTQGYALGGQETGGVRGTSGIDSTVKLSYSTALSDEDAETLMNSGNQAVGINNSKTEGFLKVGYEIPYYYMLDYYLTADSEQVLSNQGIYLGMEFRNKADTGFLASVATGDQVMPFTKGQWRTFTGTFTSGTENQINGQARVNIGIRGMRGTGYIDYFRLIPKGIDTQQVYEGEKSMQVANTLTWTSDIFSVEPKSDYTYYASVRPDSGVVDGQVTYTFMDNNYNVKGAYAVNTSASDGWSAADANGWRSIDGQITIPDGATICQITLSNPNGQGNVWFDGLVFAKTEEPKVNSIRITSGNSEVVIPDSAEAQYQYIAVVYDQYNHVMNSEVAWTVANEDGTPCAGISITSNGILKIASSASEGNIIITAAKDGKTAVKRAAVIRKGTAGEPESTGQYGFNGSFTANDGDAPYGWTNSGKDVVYYTFDNGVESWKSTRTDYGAPVDGETRWANDENHTSGRNSGSLLIYNPSHNMPGAQIPNDARIQGGMPYRFELYFKQKNITDDSVVRVNLRYFNSNSGTIAETPNMLRYYPNEYASNANAAGWQKWSGTEVVPVNASTVRMEMRYRGGLNNSDGYAWFDDVKISKVSGLDKEKTYNGNPSLMLVGYNEDKTTTGKEYGERWLSDKLNNISQGTAYEYSAMLQTHAADTGAYLSFIFYDASGNEISTVKSDKITGTTNDWKELKGSVTAPGGAISAAVAYNIDGRGTAWVSDISFRKMSDSGITGIRINGAPSVRVPISGSRTESYTVVCVNSAGNAVNAADAVITADNLPSGATFTNGALTVTSGAAVGTVRLSAAYGGYTAELNVAITKSSDASSNGGGGGGGGNGTGGGTTSGGGGNSSGGASSGVPMGNVNYGGANSSDQTGSNNTSEVPTLLQAPAVDYFSGGSNSVFEDIDGVPWAKQPIEALYRAGVVNGKAENLFAPEDAVTRAEFVTMLVKAFQLTSDNRENGFADVNEGDWYYNSVNIAVDNGIISGISADYFGAEENITRQDIAVMGVRLWNSFGKEMTGKYKASFTDFETVAEYALDAVTAMAEAGVVNGTETGAFAPLDNATRAEAAVIIYRMAVKYDE